MIKENKGLDKTTEIEYNKELDETKDTLDAQKKLREDVLQVEIPAIEAQNESVNKINEAKAERFDPGISPAKTKVKGKKGTTSWKPSALLHVDEGLKDPRYVYHWLRNDPANLSRKLAEGWEQFDKVSTSCRKV